jgi:hypothetical protein
MFHRIQPPSQEQATREVAAPSLVEVAGKHRTPAPANGTPHLTLVP